MAQSDSDSAPVYWEDFHVGRVMTTGSLEVTREEIIDFATRYDPQRFHVDEEAARRTPYGGLIASGWMTCAMTMRMICDAYINGAAGLGSPGMDKVQWMKPVRPGDLLTVRTTVVEARPMNSKPDVGLAKSRMETLNQDGEVVLTMEGWGMYRRRGSA